MISAERLRKLMHYEPDTGEFRWRERSAGRPVGRPAGSNKQRYRQIHIDYCHYQAHRLAWLYMTGEWPQEIDHIDRNGFNNRWSNLRAVTHAENMRNRQRTGSVMYVARRRKWWARLTVDGHTRHLGYFDTEEEAQAAYRAAKAALWHAHAQRLQHRESTP